MEKQLDIRSFLKLYLDVHLIVKRTMTEPQRKLFAYQRDRLPLLEDHQDYSSHSDFDLEKDIYKPKSVDELTTLISQYKIETDLDRKLLLGVLVRDYDLKKEELFGIAKIPVEPQLDHHAPTFSVA